MVDANQKGFSLLELMISLSILTMFIGIILPSLIMFREKQKLWQDEIAMEQEAIRFFTYMQNRSATVSNWIVISNQSVILETCEMVDSRYIRRQIYQFGDRIIERDVENNGTIILSHLVERVLFTKSNNLLDIQLTLRNRDHSRTYHGFITRRIHSCQP
jgi:prepilin-type N-terminal cleavage/methylation domain-containing protein